jgi:hypothetical protein
MIEEMLDVHPAGSVGEVVGDTAVVGSVLECQTVAPDRREGDSFLLTFGPRTAPL